LEAVLYRGELPRADVAAHLGVTDRQARRIAADLSAFGIITSDSARGPRAAGIPGNARAAADAGLVSGVRARAPWRCGS
jgi:hypothetical protein